MEVFARTSALLLGFGLAITGFWTIRDALQEAKYGYKPSLWRSFPISFHVFYYSFGSIGRKLGYERAGRMIGMLIYSLIFGIGIFSAAALLIVYGIGAFWKS